MTKNAELGLGAPSAYADIAGFCKSATTAEIAAHGYPPDLQEQAVKTVLDQAELLCADWV